MCHLNDASKWGIVAKLSQEQEGTGRNKICGHLLYQVYTQLQRRMRQTKLEFECLYAALRYCKMFLYNCHFHIITDCKSLLNWQTIFAQNNTAIICKLQELYTFNFSISQVKRMWLLSDQGNSD